MNAIPTVAIVGEDGQRKVINQSDFNEDEHEIWEGDEPAAPPANDSTEGGGEDGGESGEGETGGEPNPDVPTKTQIAKMTKAQLKDTLNKAHVPFEREDKVGQLQERALKHFYAED